MKKVIIAILMAFGTFSTVSADIGVSVGVSGQVGSMETSGSELSSDTTTATRNSNVREALFATGGFFIEKDLKFIPLPLINRLSIGYDNIAHDLDMGTVTNSRIATIATQGTVTAAAHHQLNAKVDGFKTVYATLAITDWLYFKAGNVDVDVKTDFKGTTTSTYATNHTLDGTMFGAGIQLQSDHGLFFRLEYNDYDIGGKTVTNTGTDSKLSARLNDVSGTTGRISVGKKF
jgi:hypothetical protein